VVKVIPIRPFGYGTILQLAGKEKYITMKKYSFLPVLLALTLLTGLSSCELIGDIFRAGVWVGVILVVGIIALILFIIRKIF